MSVAVWDAMAVNDLRESTTDPHVRAILVHTAERVLRIPPSPSKDEGWLRDEHHAFRRAVPRDDPPVPGALAADDVDSADDDYGFQFSEYFYVYRRLTSGESGELGTRSGRFAQYLIVRLLSNRDFTDVDL